MFASLWMASKALNYKNKQSVFINNTLYAISKISRIKVNKKTKTFISDS